MSFLYVCHFSNGHIKVGRSIEPLARIAQHEERVSCMGVELVEHAIFECFGNVERAESDLIDWCAQGCAKRHKSEWFVGLDFQDACDQARICSLRPPPVASEETGLDRAVAHFGGVGRLAAALGIGQSVVSNWKARGTAIDAIQCTAIERLTDGAVTRKQLRPKDWQAIWPELADEKAGA